VKVPVATGGWAMYQYLYDASGKRVGMGTIGTFSCNASITGSGGNGFTLKKQYILGPSGEQMTEVDYSGSSATWAHTNAYAGDVVATYLNDGQGPHYRLADWLGTTRVQVNSSGTVELTCASLPFGDTSTPCVGATEQFFTGQERDQETGNDYFQARHYASNTGRFISPDPSGLQYADISNPQSFNLYAYVRNNPLIFRDPTGLECVWDDGSYDSNDDSSTGDGAVDRSGNHTGCSGAGGTWVDHSYFTDNNMADWSSQANQDLADMITPSVTVTASDNGSLMDAVQNTLDNVRKNSMNLWGVWNYTALDVFKWAADPKVQHTPNGCASGILGCLYHHGNWCGAGGSGAPVDGQDSACLVHDFLYAKYGFTAGSNYGSNNPGLQEINQGLCNTAGSGAISAYFGFGVGAGNIATVNWMGNPSCKTQ
jgi:RHS repeat-associated protein